VEVRAQIANGQQGRGRGDRSGHRVPLCS
jgi:hypothetical protein